MALKEIPVLLLTGYLGSGKTTLVNRILSNRKGIRFAVIVNDIGEVNIDADLIAKGGVVGKKGDSLVALQNGCICCTLKMDLVEQLREITAMRKFDYIVIEASGICEPEPIARTICSIPTLGVEYVKDGIARLDCIVTVVDALRLRDEFASGASLIGAIPQEEDLENLVIRQIEFCNIILLNKASEVDAEARGKIRTIIRTIQPKAQIIECDYGDVELDKLLDTGLFNYEDVSASAAWIKGVEGAVPDEEHEHEHEHEHHHHHDDEGEAEEYGIGTFVYCRRQPLDINKFDNFIARHWPRNVIRAKGICYFSENPGVCYLFEQAGSQVGLSNIGQWFCTMPPAQLERMLDQDPVLRRDWDDNYGDRMQKLVFIGQNMDREAITEALDACLEEDCAML